MPNAYTQQRALFSLLWIAAGLLFLFLFALCSIEAGEERPWFLLWAVLAPVYTGLLTVWSTPAYAWQWRALSGVVVAALVLITLVKTVRLADRINDEPALFRRVLPAVVRLESTYIEVFSIDRDRIERLHEKWKMWSATNKEK